MGPQTMMMELEQVLRAGQPPPRDQFALDYDDFVRWFWKHKGLLKERERVDAFWEATHENLKLAYEALDERETRLEEAYRVMRDDLQVAQQIQSAQLPSLPALMDGELELAVHHSQLSAVGGDYYDFFETVDGRYAVGVFDISGHGVAAALAMAFLRSELIHAAAGATSPRRVADEVNARILDFMRKVKRYATINYVLFEPLSIRYVCGGGNGLLVRDGQMITFAKGDPFLGLRNRPYRESVLPFDDGDILALYTDGIIEAQNSDEADYTIRRLNTLIHRHATDPVDSILETCIEDFEGFCREPHDDVTLMIMRKKSNE